MDNIKVSVIVPVYNGEKFVERCILVLLKQTLEDMEFIFVNDASKDKSLRILRKYESKYQGKIVLINSKENNGPGGARNLGIEKARGKYIGFVDCDDIVGEEMFKSLYNLAEEESCDVADCLYYDEMKKIIYMMEPSIYEGELTDAKIGQIIGQMGFLWHRIYKKSLIVENNIKFRKNATYEDIDFLCRVYCCMKKIRCITKPFYKYCYNENSTSREIDGNRIKKDTKNCLDELKKIREAMAGRQEIEEKLDFLMIHTSADILGYYVTRGEMTKDEFYEFDEFLKNYVPKYKTRAYTEKELENEKIQLIASINENIDKSYEKIISRKWEQYKG